MKIIKKITAIMLSVMMVLGMCSVVGAAGAGISEKGSIKINNAIVGQDYKIYKMLELESFDEDKKLYSYKPASEAWATFFNEGGAGAEYVNINENGYVTWKPEAGEDEAKKAARAAELSQKALAYVKEKSIAETKKVTATGEERTTTINFNDLGLGYYLIDSTAGTLCGLTTTNRNVEILEKNVEPTVDKKIEITDDTLEKKSSANLGEQVIFRTTISVKPGANNYVLHDKMDSNLEFGAILHVYDNWNDKYKYVQQTDLQDNGNFQVIANPEDCTFELKFLDKFYEDRAELINQGKVTTITVQYYAIVKNDAPINTAMPNKAWLTYGDKNTESNKSETETYTYGIPVYKYTMKDSTKSGLAGAEFSLYTDDENAVGTILNFKNTGNEYRYTEEAVGAKGTTTTLQSPEDGNFNINGLKAGTYWLKETEAPKGYNKLPAPIKIVIEQNTDGTKTIKNAKGEAIEKVEVENKSGSLLPSTGGIGTTIFYIAGALLVLAAGVVLIAKKRTDSK